MSGYGVGGWGDRYRLRTPRTKFPESPKYVVEHDHDEENCVITSNYGKHFLCMFLYTIDVYYSMSSCMITNA